MNVNAVVYWGGSCIEWISVLENIIQWRKTNKILFVFATSKPFNHFSPYAGVFLSVVRLIVLMFNLHPSDSHHIYIHIIRCIRYSGDERIQRHYNNNIIVHDTLYYYNGISIRKCHIFYSPRRWLKICLSVPFHQAASVYDIIIILWFVVFHQPIAQQERGSIIARGDCDIFPRP